MAVPPRVHLFYNFLEMAKHKAPRGFPERAARLVGIETALTASGIWDRCETHRVTEPFPREKFVEVYGEKEVRRWENAVRIASGTTSKIVPDDVSGDIYWSDGTLTAASYAAAAAVAAVRVALAATSEPAHSFAIVRPPGHHCFEQPSGFCIANNIVLAAREALEAGRRVAIVDWDYHFGDGTALAFLEEPNVMFCSLHCDRSRTGAPTYPAHPLKGWELADATAGRMFNIMWPLDDADDAAYEYAFERLVCPAIRRFGADLILVSAGYDALRGDDLAGMELTPPVFYRLAQRLRGLGLPIACVLEGGYNTTLLGRGVHATIEGLSDPVAATTAAAPMAGHKGVVDAIAARLGILN